MTKVDYALSGCANAHPVRITGMGTATAKRVRIAFTAAEALVTFDAGLAHFAGIDAVVAVVGGVVKEPDGPLVARCRADLLGEGGAEVGTIVAVATVERRRGRLACRAQLAEAQVAFEPGERLASIGARPITVVPQWNGVALLSATTIATSRGREITVLVTTFLVEASAGQRPALLLPTAAIARSGALLRIGVE